MLKFSSPFLSVEILLISGLIFCTLYYFIVVGYFLGIYLLGDFQKQTMVFFPEWLSIAIEFFSRGKSVETVPPGLSFAGQTVLVTGATSGLGFEAAVLLVRLGAENVYITARTMKKGLEARSRIQDRTGRRGVVHVRVLDMDTFETVKQFMRDIQKDVPTIDVVLLNAGVHNFSYQKSTEGWEGDLQVNVLSTTLLGLLALQWMSRVRKPGQVQHLTFTGSASHIKPDIQAPDFEQQSVLKFWNQEKNWVSGRSQYATSKLFLTYCSREIAMIAERNKTSSLVVNSVCPGLIKTEISRGFKGRGLIFKWLEAFFMWWKAGSAEDGAKTLVVATTTSDNGAFRRPFLSDTEYERKAERNIFSTAGQKMQARVWKEVLGVLREKSSEVVNVVEL